MLKIVFAPWCNRPAQIQQDIDPAHVYLHAVYVVVSYVKVSACNNCLLHWPFSQRRGFMNGIYYIQEIPWFAKWSQPIYVINLPMEWKPKGCIYFFLKQHIEAICIHPSQRMSNISNIGHAILAGRIIHGSVRKVKSWMKHAYSIQHL